MLYKLLIHYIDSIALFKYITFRASMAAITALLFSFIFGKKIIQLIIRLNIKENIREDGPTSHFHKKDTPTMGGIIILLSILSGVLLWADLSNRFILLLLSISVLFAILGLTDDIIKRKNKNGVIARYKLLVQIIIGSIIAIFVIKSPDYINFATSTNLIFIKNYMLNLSILFIPFVIIVITGTSNAVNLADGLDGLAIGMLAIIFSVFTILAYITGHMGFTNYLNMQYIPHSGEITIFLSASAAACLGFLWYNANPAEIFMGDTGSLTLGGILGTSAVLIKQEILLFIAGGMFVIEALSVILQVGYFKMTQKRLFLMAPIHHSFEKKGIHENKIVIRFWIMSILFGILALSTLKLR